MYPITMLFAHNSTAFIYQLHCNWGAISPLFLRPQISSWKECLSHCF